MISPKTSMLGNLIIKSEESLDEFKECECHCEYSEEKSILNGYFIITPKKNDPFLNVIYGISYFQKTFVFKTQSGNRLEGIIQNVEPLVPLSFIKYKFNFKASSILEYRIFETFKTTNLIFSFNIPYVSLFDKGFSKDLERPKNNIFYEHKKQHDYYFIINGIHLWIKQDIELKKDGLIKATLRKKMYLDSILFLEEGKKHVDVINKTEEIVKDMFTIYSLIFSMKINSNGFEVEGVSPEGRDLEVFYRDFKIKQNNFEVAEEDLDDNFKKYFINENLSELISSFVNLDDQKKNKTAKFINMLCTCYKLDYFEANFLYLFSLLEGVAKVFWDDDARKKFKIDNPNKRNASSETIIKNALKRTGLEKYNNFFMAAKKLGVLSWHITEYRHDLMHFNDTYEFDEKLFWESMKMMQICRKLIFATINPKFIEFPFHNNGNNNTSSPKGFKIVGKEKE
ncbi:MAG: hypothetical protein K1X86_07520 [Ignavibacteria bacterium]|nr:hypothetical protein [Ignavibacteria bacterium]